MRSGSSARRFIVPQVLQSSLTDCGPAALKAALDGFGIRADYDELRERCGTDVDGTSLDSLAALGCELGLRAQPVLIARDSLLLPESDALPAIAVTRTGGGLLHFILLWGTAGGRVQVMDPGAGRRWLAAGDVLSRIPDLPIPISMGRWRAWATSENALAPLRARMRRIGMRTDSACALIDHAAQDPSWRALGTLDAAVRMLTHLVAARALRRSAARRLLPVLLRHGLAGDGGAARIPSRFWWVEPQTGEQLLARGAVILHLGRGDARSSGPSGASEEARAQPLAAGSRGPGRTPRRRTRVEPAPAPHLLPAALLQVLRESELRPFRVLWQLLRWDSPRTPLVLCAALACSAAVTGVEAILLRGVWQVGGYLALGYQRAAALLALLTFALSGLLLEAFIGATMHRLGLRLEMRLRAALLEKVPRLQDRYLRTRASWDLASRAHALHTLRDAPVVVTQLTRAVLTVCTTLAALLWLHPSGARWLCISALLALAVPWLTRRPLADGALRLRSQGAALDRLHLDALLGATAVRVHGAERAVQREHEDLLVDWTQEATALHGRNAAVVALNVAATALGTLGLVASYLHDGRDLSGLLLLVYWSMRSGAAAQEIVGGATFARNLRAVALRLLSPLGARSTDADSAPAQIAGPTPWRAGGIAIGLRDVSVQAGGRALLSGISTQIAAGSHVAIVGASGAGKSSLLGLLLGWLDPERGVVTLDGEPVDAGRLRQLHAETAWIDPAVALWARSLYANVAFGSEHEQLERLPHAMELADLTELLDQLPEGLRADVGEGGSRLSAGQGQRVRLARGLLRRDARLVVLDEAFRGLDRAKRRDLLARVRQEWADATLLFASHDVSDTQEFDRVLVLAGGRLVEDERPDALLARPNSVYGKLVEADRALRPHAWWVPHWRRARLEAGRMAGAQQP